MSRALRHCAVAILVVASGLAMSASATASPPAGITTVASGLDNPRGIILGPAGILLVAEAGTGGTGACVQAPGQPDPNVKICVGTSGAVTAIIPGHGSSAPHQLRVIRNLPSLAGADGTNSVGPHDLAISGGKLFATIGLGGAPQMRNALGPEGALFGQVVRLRLVNPATSQGDVLSFEAANNPDGTDPGGLVDSNPYGLLGDGNGATIATDAAGNTVLGIDSTGNVSTIAVLHVSQAPAPPFLGLPPGTMIPMQGVPTTVTRGPDGALYVGQLTGFPFPAGGAQVFRIGPGGTLTPFASGFTNIIDMTFDHSGRLLVLSYAKDGLLSSPPGAPPAGSLTRVNADGSRTELAAGMLTAPGGVVVGADGAIYVTNHSTSVGAGEVLRIPA